MSREGEDRGDDAEAPDAWSLMPRLERRTLSCAVRQARDVAADAERDAAALAPNIAAHLTTLSMVLDTLAAHHQAVADQFDFDLMGNTRYAAAWQLAGRSIGLGQAVVALLRARFCAETLVLARALHECTRLLDALGDPEDGDELLRRWLEDDDKRYVRPWEAREAERRAAERLRIKMETAGATPIKGTVDLSRDLYHHLSWFGHNRRRAVQDFVSEPQRTMIRGPHPDTRVVAVYIAWGGQVIEEVLLSVGESLARFWGTRYLRDHQIPLQQAIKAVRHDSPLS